MSTFNFVIFALVLPLLIIMCNGFCAALNLKCDLKRTYTELQIFGPFFKRSSEAFVLTGIRNDLKHDLRTISVREF